MVKIAGRFKRLAKWYTGKKTLPDPSVVGDIGDLYVRGDRIRKFIDDLLRQPLRSSNRDLIEKKLGMLIVFVQEFGWIARDLRDPLERLVYGSSPSPRRSRVAKGGEGSRKR